MTIEGDINVQQFLVKIRFSQFLGLPHSTPWDFSKIIYFTGSFSIGYSMIYSRSILDKGQIHRAH